MRLTNMTVSWNLQYTFIYKYKTFIIYFFILSLLVVAVCWKKLISPDFSSNNDTFNANWPLCPFLFWTTWFWLSWLIRYTPLAKKRKKTKSLCESMTWLLTSTAVVSSAFTHLPWIQPTCDVLVCKSNLCMPVQPLVTKMWYIKVAITPWTHADDPLSDLKLWSQFLKEWWVSVHLFNTLRFSILEIRVNDDGFLMLTLMQEQFCCRQ